MAGNTLLTLGGEFSDRVSEAAFQTSRLPETIRHCRLVFGLSALMNGLFLFSDWRFYGQDHFLVAIPARLAVIAVSIACLLAVLRVERVRQAITVIASWQAITACAVALLVTSRTDLALFVVLLLPSAFYLLVPTTFRATVAAGVFSSVLLLAGYLGPHPDPAIVSGFVLALVTLNVALTLAVVRNNRLSRLEWAATQAERRTKDDLAASRAMMERLFMAVPIPFLVISGEGRVQANDAAVAFLGSETATETCSSLLDAFIDGDRRRDFLVRLEAGERIEAFEAEIRDAQGQRRDVLITATPMTIGATPATVCGIVDITERKTAEAEARVQASHDMLTRLPNRALFQSQLAEALTAVDQRNGHATVFLIDLDDFKAVNDTLGHDAGDALLVQVAAKLIAVAGPDDVVARLGGDEFVILCRQMRTLAQAQAKAERFILALQEPVTHRGHSLSARASVGVAKAPEHDREAIELMKDADLALYRAKSLGRNVAVTYDPGMRAPIIERVRLCRDVQSALEDERIVPYYQAQIDLSSGAIVGFEALARWRHPTRGLIAAGAFADVFNEPELAVAIGNTMLRQVVADVKAWLAAGLDCGTVSINLASSAFRDPELADMLLGKLSDTDIPAHRFGVEVTESVLLARTSHDVAGTLLRLRDAGVRIAFDDFGTGYASLTHLKRFPVDTIKIDRTFVQDVETDEGDAAIVRAVLELGRNLQLDVIAEGVETEGQEAFLYSHGCGMVQGFRYAKPVAASRVPWLISEPNLMPEQWHLLDGAARASAA